MTEIRVIHDAETLEHAAAVFRQAMFGLPGAVMPEENWAEKFVEPGRVYGAWLDGTLAGTVNSFRSEITLPGGKRVSHAGVTHVGVLPHFARRGVLRGLFSRQLQDLYQQGTVIATLRASQGTIYRRFGYGIASWAESWLIDKNALPPQPKPQYEVLAVPAEQAWPQLRAVASRYPIGRPGYLTRWDAWWEMQAFILSKSTPNHYVALVLVDGEAQAFARYHAQPNDGWLYSRERTLVVDDLHAAHLGHQRALLQHLLGLDVTQRVRLTSVPQDDPLVLWLDNVRAAQIQARNDESWLRIINVEQALNHRRFNGGEAVRVQVIDDLLPENNGVWQISADGSRRSDRQPDITLSIADLGALLLGGTQAWQLAWSQDIAAAGSAAIERLDSLFSTPVRPWSGILF